MGDDTRMSSLDAWKIKGQFSELKTRGKAQPLQTSPGTAQGLRQPRWHQPLPRWHQPLPRCWPPSPPPRRGAQVKLAATYLSLGSESRSSAVPFGRRQPGRGAPPRRSPAGQRRALAPRRSASLEAPARALRCPQPAGAQSGGRGHREPREGEGCSREGAKAPTALPGCSDTRGPAGVGKCDNGAMGGGGGGAGVRDVEVLGRGLRRCWKIE